jgi:hypothetical protein
MFYIGEPLLKPLAIAIVLICAALVSQPLWAKIPARSGHIPQANYMVFVDANRTMDQEPGFIQADPPVACR